MADLTRIHRIVEIITDGLLKGIPLCKVVFPDIGMAGNTIQALGFMDICFRTPLTSPLFSIRVCMTGPTIFIRGSSDDLEVEILEIRHLFFGIVYIHLVHFQISRHLGRGFQQGPTCPYRRPIFEKPSS
jgi:hypothetical protein